MISQVNVADMYSCKVVKIEKLMNIRYYEYTVVFMITEIWSSVLPALGCRFGL